jgi:hypothetical protein
MPSLGEPVPSSSKSNTFVSNENLNKVVYLLFKLILS